MKHLWLIALLFACEGPMGPQGARGPKGSDGVANITTKIFTISSTSSITTAGFIGSYIRNISEITSDVVDSGLVLMYLGSGTSWELLPHSANIDYDLNLSVDEVVKTIYLYYIGAVEILFITSYSFLDASRLPLGPYKVVIISPTSLGKVSSIDLNDYNSIVNALSIE